MRIERERYDEMNFLLGNKDQAQADVYAAYDSPIHKSPEIREQVIEGIIFHERPSKTHNRTNEVSSRQGDSWLTLSW